MDGIFLEHHAQGICPYRCYTISFYPNGSKKTEGVLLWDESADSDFFSDFATIKILYNYLMDSVFFIIYFEDKSLIIGIP